MDRRAFLAGVAASAAVVGVGIGVAQYTRRQSSYILSFVNDDERTDVVTVSGHPHALAAFYFSWQELLWPGFGALVAAEDDAVARMRDEINMFHAMAVSTDATDEAVFWASANPQPNKLSPWQQLGAPYGRRLPPGVAVCRRYVVTSAQTCHPVGPYITN